MKNYGKNTPPGTPPQPTRRSSKRRHVGYGAELMAKAAARRERRAARVKKAA